MEREAVQTRILVGVALLLAALIAGYYAFYVPQVTRPVVVTVALNVVWTRPSAPRKRGSASM